MKQFAMYIDLIAGLDSTSVLLFIAFSTMALSQLEIAGIIGRRSNRKYLWFMDFVKFPRSIAG